MLLQLETLIVSSLTDEGRVGVANFVTIDAPPGSGKTHSLCALVNTIWTKYRIKTCFTVFSNTCVAPIRTRVPEAFTCCKFLMKSLSMSFDSIKILFDEASTVEQMFCKIYKLAFNCDVSSWDIIILDEYTTISPWLIVFLFFVGKIHKKMIIFAGDKNQQASVSKSQYLKGNNAQLLDLFAPSIELNAQYRITDPAYLDFINDLKLTINGCKNSKLNFHQLYKMFCHLRATFLTKAQVNIFIAPYHTALRQRMTELGTGGTWVPFVIQRTGEQVLLPEHEKFHSALLLKIGLPYLYCDGDKIRHVVTLVSVSGECVYVQFQGTVHTLRRVPLIPWVDEEHLWITSQVTGVVVQFPIRPMCVTYYAVQGLTLDTAHKIDLALDGATINAVYVGLSRVATAKQINSMKTKQLFNLMITAHCNDEYYYHYPASAVMIDHVQKYPKKPLEQLRNIPTFANKSAFETCQKGRCLKSAYDITPRKTTPGTMVRVLEFIMGLKVYDKRCDTEQLLQLLTNQSDTNNASCSYKGGLKRKHV